MIGHINSKMCIEEIILLIEALSLGASHEMQHEIEIELLTKLESRVDEGSIDEAKGVLMDFIQEVQIYIEAKGEEGEFLSKQLFWDCIYRNVLDGFVFGIGARVRLVFDEVSGNCISVRNIDGNELLKFDV
ncbi:hypothetical protein [Reichenbachiella sp.]|uniref:hypothetical protein n=1 Tax=Reichenbachiella sp. TaxID=2184521 RepID=UPI003B59C3A2